MTLAAGEGVPIGRLGVGMSDRFVEKSRHARSIIPSGNSARMGK